MPPSKAASVELENVNHPGKTQRGDARKYEAMKAAILAVLPRSAPGMTVDELRAAVLPRLPNEVFPGGATAGWWLKAAQLDLEAKGIVAREATKPLRLHRV